MVFISNWFVAIVSNGIRSNAVTQPIRNVISNFNIIGDFKQFCKFFFNIRSIIYAHKRLQFYPEFW